MMLVLVLWCCGDNKAGAGEGEGGDRGARRGAIDLFD